MSNFDYLANKSEFSSLYDACLAADGEKDSSKKASLCRDALIILISFVYREDEIDQNESLLELIDGETFVSFFEKKEYISAAHFIRKIGSNAKHGLNIKKTYADLALDRLNLLVDFTYSKDNKTLSHPIVNSTLVFNEALTRKHYIDVYLNEAGWEVVEPTDTTVLPGGIVVKSGNPIASKACCEIPVEGMDNKSGIGFCDYVLYGRNGKPLAIVEAKATSKEITLGSFQVKEYGECMRLKFGYIPILYYTNGYEIYVIDGLYPARKVMAFHTQEELEYMLQKRSRVSMSDLTIRNDISGRPYQKMAITKLCEHFNNNYRRGLLVMATGTGKTRVAISIVDVMLRNKWIKNVLFLADRTSLVEQAYKNFSDILKDLSYCVLSDHRRKYDENARVCFSTHQTMIRLIDDENKKFSIGRFDLIIVDEAHRSIFKKYGSIFKYFDSFLVGLTATPKDEVDASTYELFNCENGEPDYVYSMEEAVAEHYLVPYKTSSLRSKLLNEGTKFCDLSDSDKSIVNAVNDGVIDDAFELKREEFFTKYYNVDTCSKILDELMKSGLKVDCGQKLGKTIIFAYNHKHAKMIVETFKRDFPYNDNYCQLIDNQVKDSLRLIEKFGTDDDFRIAVSVDMLDTGIDVPATLNLVFFKPVKSKIKFVQMIGRGTRLCEGLVDGEDKSFFKIFDCCGNFEYFKMTPNGQDTSLTKSISQRLFEIKLDLIVELQGYQYQADPTYVDYYRKWKEELQNSVMSLKNNSTRISIREEMEYVDKYCNPKNWDAIFPLQKKEMQYHLSKLIANDLDEDSKVLSFDAQMFLIEFSILAEKGLGVVSKQVKNVRNSCRKLLQVASATRDVQTRTTTLKKVCDAEYWQDVDMLKLESTREEIRTLMALLKEPITTGDTNIKDEITSKDLDDIFVIDIRTYKEKVVDYLYENSSNETIRKIKNLEQINVDDLKELERILWQELGTEDDYKKATSIDNLAAFIRSIVGIEQDVVNEKFGEFLNDNVLNSQQQEFVKAIIEYVRQNGDISKEDLIEISPFNHYDMLTLFGTNVGIIIKIVDRIHNSIVAA